MIEQQLDETAEERRRRVNREKAREYRENPPGAGVGIISLVERTPSRVAQASAYWSAVSILTVSPLNDRLMIE